MSPEKWQKIKAIFNEAIELSPDERENYLNSFNGSSVEILTEVRKLLEAEKKNDFENPIAEISHLWRGEKEEENLIGKQIGEYKILKEIGHGGMGIVFEAVREKEDFSQTFALKILKRGMDSDAMLRRFRHERRILASLEHPNIARLFDGGMTSDGLPFFAMEFVEGKSLDDYCNEKDLNVSERLRLFLQVCAAVSFAHSQLVVHRDLKPTNIFVTENGTVKLLDFGIAKILLPDGDAQNQTVTSLGMMTPAFASPEQIRGETVSTASDIYSLGLILFELLTGTQAYNFSNNRPDEIAKIICESEPPRPSSVISQHLSGNNKNTKNDVIRTTNPKSKIQNPKSLKGDLDNIILKALRKEPARRYASVEQFAGDVSRHLEGLPVIARPDTFSYRFEKYVKRNRVYIMTASLVLLTLTAGIVVAGWQAYRAEKQRRVAEERFRQVRELANNIVFKYYDEAAKLPNSTNLREMFVKDSLDYFDSLAKDENADDELKTELGKTFLQIARVQGRAYSPNLGQTVGAMENYQKGIDILEPIALNSANAELQTDLISAYADYAAVLSQSGDAAQSQIVFEKMRSAGETFLQQKPDNDALAARLATGYLFWGDSLPIGDGENESLTIYRKSLAVYENLLRKNPDDFRINSYKYATTERIGNVLMTMAKAEKENDNSVAVRLLQECRILFEQNVGIGKRMLELYPNQIISPAILASAELNLGTLLIETSDHAEALEHLQKAETFYRQSMQTDQTSVGQKIEVSTVEQKLAIIYLRNGDVKKAEKLFAHAFELLDYLVKKDGENFDYIKTRAAAKFDYADELVERGESGKARLIYKRAFDEMTAIAQKKNPAYADSMRGLLHEKLGNCFLAETGNENLEKAIVEYQKALEIWNKSGARTILGNEQKNKIEILQKKIERLNPGGNPRVSKST